MDVDQLDTDKIKAQELEAALKERHIACNLHWDRSPWGVRIPLTDDTDEYSPSLYVLTEGTREVAGFPDTRVWFGQLGNFEETIMDRLYDTGFEWIERHWSGQGTESVAEMLVPLVSLLKHGVSQGAKITTA